MRALIDIIHPAHVHFFRNPIQELRARGHTVHVTSREKDCTVELLDSLGIEHEVLSRQSAGSLAGMARELWHRNRALARVARAFRPDVIAGIGGVCAAQVGRWLGVRSAVFYDTENATLQNALTYPFATSVHVPECYRGWTVRSKTHRYRGYHELSYLHPTYFVPDRAIAIANGLAPEGDTFLVRVVSWQANHDVGMKGWTTPLLEAVVHHLAANGRVLISAEGAMPTGLEQYRYTGATAALHHVLAHCRAYVGESATMASEAVVLGVPAVYAATVSRGYVDEQQSRYGLAAVTGIGAVDEILDAVSRMVGLSPAETAARHRTMLDETVDVAAYVADVLERGETA